MVLLLAVLTVAFVGFVDGDCIDCLLGCVDGGIVGCWVDVVDGCDVDGTSGCDDDVCNGW